MFNAPARIVVSYCVISLIRTTDALCCHYTGDRCQSGRGHDLHNEFVSEQMNHYSDEERRSGEALKEIGREWRKQ